MKKRIICGTLAAVCLLGGASALASSSSGESLISLSYLTGQFFPALKGDIQTRAEEGTRGVYNDAQARLDGLGSQYIAGVSGSDSSGQWRYSDALQTMWLKRGDVVTLSTGSTVLWLAGVGSAEAGLVDATEGKELSGQLAVGHRCINGAEERTVAVTILSDAAQLSVQGVWTLAESSESVTSFTDLVQSRDWFYGSMRYAVDRGLFTGISGREVSPFGTMNRAMLATVLYRMDGSRPVDRSGSFPDVPAGQWYTGGIEWAASAGVVNGLDNGTFGPFNPVTREQLAVMLYRYAGNYLRLDVSQSGNLSAYGDAGKVSGWARDAMAWAVGTGIITGSDGSLLPYNNASRAEVATMLQRFQSWMSR